MWPRGLDLYLVLYYSCIYLQFAASKVSPYGGVRSNDIVFQLKSFVVSVFLSAISGPVAIHWRQSQQIGFIDQLSKVRSEQVSSYFLHGSDSTGSKWKASPNIYIVCLVKATTLSTREL